MMVQNIVQNIDNPGDIEYTISKECDYMIATNFSNVRNNFK